MQVLKSICDSWLSGILVEPRECSDVTDQKVTSCVGLLCAATDKAEAKALLFETVPQYK